MDVERNTVAPNTARFSRYRSVRKAISQEDYRSTPAVPAIPDVVQENHAPISRAPSRYHRPAAPRAVEATPPVAVSPPAQKLPARYQRRTLANNRQTTPETEQIESNSAQPARYAERLPSNVQTPPQTFHETQTYETIPAARSADKRTTRYRSRTVTSPQARQSVRRSSYDAAREEARLILEGEYDRLQKLKIQQEKAEKERKMRVDAKLAAQRKAQQQAATQAQEQSQDQEQPKRSRKWTIGGSSGTTSTPPSAPQSPPAQILPPIRASHSRDASPDSRNIRRELTNKGRSTKEPDALDETASTPKRRVRRTTHSRPREAPVQRGWEPKAGDGPPTTAVNGPQPTTDAPISAVNAGERRVEVRYEKSKITLPVTPTTTVKDLLNSASVIMSQPIDPRTAVLVETYYPLGLERPLRRYEHIRDVMNSWDSDTQNYLMILPQSECTAIGLDQKDSPSMQPSLTMVHLLHSQRPGKWEKHWMTLKADGQVTASTKENDGNATNVFHLSDFDVYMPTKKEMRKVRPPKKTCFAIKSQQRSIMFESTENFVHFFSTNDKAVAEQWYNAVQAWRSWYLVNVLEAGTGPKPTDAAAAVAATAVAASDPRRPSTSHSRDSIPYQLGTFQPFLDFSADAFRYGEDASSAQPMEVKAVTSPKRSNTLINHARSRSMADEKVPSLQRHTTTKKQRPTMAPTKLDPNVMVAPPPPSSTDAAFTGTGLLARAFSVRKTQAEGSIAFMENTDNAFTGKGLLSKRQSTKQLVRENPNPGVIADTNGAFTGAGLISRKVSVKKTLPTQEELYPGVVQNTNDAFTGAGLISRKISVKKSTNDDLFPGVIQNTNEAFTGGGMLSMQRALTKKRSAATARPGQPFLDLSGSSDFVDRSLLRQVEQYEIETGANMPIIDRSRGIEVKEKTGEV